MKKKDEECPYPDCPANDLGNSLEEVKRTLSSLSSQLEDIKTTQNKLIDFFSDYKVLLHEIKTINEDLSKLEAENKGAHEIFFRELKELGDIKLAISEFKEFKISNEADLTVINKKIDKKVDTDDFKENKNWIWSLVTSIVTLLISYLLFGGGTHLVK